MQTTMELLEQAVATTGLNLRQMSARLDLAANTLHALKHREHLSPAIAGSVAELVGEPVEKWIVIAALERDKDSACKERMLKRIGNWRKRSLPNLAGLADRVFRVRKAIGDLNARAFRLGRLPA